ncbi:MAG: hypothetical protein SGARI_002951 [Bacillariaceae sp.]
MNTAIATKLSDMEWSKPVQCGQNKCFVASRTNQTTGYLIARGAYTLKEMKKGCELEARMAKKYGTTPLTLQNNQQQSSPVMAFWNLSDAMLDVLKDYGPPKKSLPIVVTPVKKVPSPNLLVKLQNDGPKWTKKRIPKFARLLRRQYYGRMEQFRDTFAQEIKRLMQIVRDPKYLHLMMDFQFLLGTDGRIYYIDFERAALSKHPPVSAFKQRYKNLEASLQRMLFWLTENDDDTFAKLEDDAFSIESDDADDDATS